MLSRKLAVLTLASLLAASTGVFAESSTIRIEPRPYNSSAVVTLENGVRVWRPLPPTRQVIINPNNTPLNLSFADVRERVTHNYIGGQPAAGYTNGGAAAAPYHYGAPAYGIARPHGYRNYHRPAVRGLGPIRPRY